MDTPICDFVSKYRASKSLRLHMPGHKGRELLGFESLDITEIDAASNNGVDNIRDLVHKAEEYRGTVIGCIGVRKLTGSVFIGFCHFGINRKIFQVFQADTDIADVCRV